MVRNPHDSLTKDPFNFSTLAYPRDVTQDMANGHYILFYVNVQNKTKYRYEDFDENTVGDSYEYEQPVSTGPLSHQQSTKIVTSTGANAAEVEYAKRLIGKGKKGRVKDDVGVTYEGAATGLAGLAAAGGIDFVKAMQRNDFEAAAGELVQGTKTVVTESLKRAAAGFADMLMGDAGGSSLDLFNKAWGQAENPYLEVIFENITLRSFTYNFKFAPRNKDERDDVQAIIQLFRFHMVPELKGGNHRYMTLPSTFDIHYMWQSSWDTAWENNFYSKIATCVLESCNVDYTPGGVKSFADGSPTQITMGLTFKETEMLTKQKINDGY
jgi:hypothetical protein